jgi:predicted amidohydrolase
MNATAQPLVAAIQMNSGNQLSQNLAVAEQLLREAARQGAALAALPENFAFMGARDTDKLAHAELVGSGPIQAFLSAIARELRMWVVAGTVPVAVPGDPSKVFAASLVYDASGALAARYDKIHLFDVEVPRDGAPEKRPHPTAGPRRSPLLPQSGRGDSASLRDTQARGESYRESSHILRGEPKIVTVPTPAGVLGLSVCYDLRFPELYRALTLAGAEILCVPAAFTAKTGEAHWETLLRARAIENQCHVIAPGQFGEHPGGRRTWGHSLIVGPWGEILAQQADGAGVVIARPDRARLAQLRQSFPVLAHRRLP